jgi:hypothetical protein
MVKQYSALVLSPEISLGLEAVERDEVTGEEARNLLGSLLQAALHLEFATIPVYLSAAFSLGRTNAAIGQLVTRVAIEEMLHFIVVANTMNAIGIAPNVRAAVPTYPCDLAILTPALHLDLRSFSLELVENLFLRIETPEDPIVFENLAVEPARTIGQFYQGIIDILEAGRIPALFELDPSRRNAAVIPDPPAFRRIRYRNDQDQGTYPIPASIDFNITDAASAVRHLKWLVDQGEGTSRDDTNPIDPSGLPAHYYRFVSILHGKYLVEDARAEKKYSYSGGSLSFDPADVHECDPNPKVADYAGHDRLLRQMDLFNKTYSEMVAALETAFASPDQAAAKAALKVSTRKMSNMLGIPAAIYRAAEQAGVKGGVPFELVGP